MLVYGPVTQGAGGASAWGLPIECGARRQRRYGLVRGLVLATNARIRLEMRWAVDCERFEREYVEKGRWRRVVDNDENGASDRAGSFCHRSHDLCGDRKTVVETTGKGEGSRVCGKWACLRLLKVFRCFLRKDKGIAILKRSYAFIQQRLGNALDTRDVLKGSKIQKSNYRFLEALKSTLTEHESRYAVLLSTNSGGFHPLTNIRRGFGFSRLDTIRASSNRFR